MKKTRESNLELLRIICMIFIVAVHLLAHGIGIKTFSPDEALCSNAIYYLLYSIFIIAVNCFILISGYFSIKPSFSGVVKLYSSVFFYGFAIFLIGTIIDANVIHIGMPAESPAGGGIMVIIKGLCRSLLPFSRPHYWFVGAYFQLYLLSPLLNAATVTLKKREFIILIALLSILTFYIGFLHKNPINPTGFNVMNFIYLYIVARYIRLHTAVESTKQKRSYYLIGYVATTLIMACISIFIMGTNNSKYFAMVNCYNNPLVVLAAICFFMYIKSFTLKSRFINWIASSCLAIYLIDDNAWVREKLSILMRDFYESYNLITMLGIILGLTVLVAVCSVAIDKIRVAVMTPIENKMSLMLSRVCNWIMNIFERIILGWL